MTLYKGPIMAMLWSRNSHEVEMSSKEGAQAKEKDWIKGSIFLIIATVAWAALFIIQVRNPKRKKRERQPAEGKKRECRGFHYPYKTEQAFLKNSQAFTLKRYSAPMSLTMLICLVGTLQAIAVTLVMEHKTSAWVIGFDMNLLAAAYAVTLSLSLPLNDIHIHTHAHTLCLCLSHSVSYTLSLSLSLSLSLCLSPSLCLSLYVTLLSRLSLYVSLVSASLILSLCSFVSSSL